MPVTLLATRPERMSLRNMTTNEVLEVQFNPPDFEETLRTEWARIASPGFSHKNLQYLGTENLSFGFDLMFDCLTGVDSGWTQEEILDARRFLHSLFYARRGAKNVREGQAPRVLLVWPTLISLHAVISDLTIKIDRFGSDGAPSRFTAKLKLEEVRDVRLYAEEVREEGTLRVAEPSEVPRFSPSSYGTRKV